VEIRTFPDAQSLAQAAAAHAAASLRSAVAERGQARIVAATGTSQLAFLQALVAREDIAWKRVELFHLDEYVGLAMDHPASFRRYLREHLIDKTGIENHHLLDGEGNLAEVVACASRAIAEAPIDVAFVGIGENAHIAFNDPPADFETRHPYLVLRLDEACRRQQVSEGWFPTPGDVPEHAISMSVFQILQSREIISVVPDLRKARAVEATLRGEVTPAVPASILQTHPRTTLYLDPGSASLVPGTP
jgi:glucosamine-6-phosphate deaminase